MSEFVSGREDQCREREKGRVTRAGWSSVTSNRGISGWREKGK